MGPRTISPRSHCFFKPKKVAMKGAVGRWRNRKQVEWHPTFRTVLNSECKFNIIHSKTMQWASDTMRKGVQMPSRQKEKMSTAAHFLCKNLQVNSIHSFSINLRPEQAQGNILSVVVR